MQRVVVDTNVLVSALIAPGVPAKIIKLVLDEKFQLFVSTEVLSEYYAVLRRDKFAKYPNFTTNADLLLSRIEELAVTLVPDQKLSLIKDDDDNRFLELAIAAKADYLITGNTNDFQMSEIVNTKVITPQEFWQTHNKA